MAASNILQNYGQDVASILINNYLDGKILDGKVAGQVAFFFHVQMLFITQDTFLLRMASSSLYLTNEVMCILEHA